MGEEQREAAARERKAALVREQKGAAWERKGMAAAPRDIPAGAYVAAGSGPGSGPGGGVAPSIGGVAPSIDGFPFIGGSFPFTPSSSARRGLWWDGTGDGSPISPPILRPQPLDPASWDNYPYPPGGFMGILNHQPQNFHFVGAPSHCAPFKAPRPTVSSGFSPPHVESPTPHSSTETHHAHEPIDVDSNDEVIRTEKRILWTPEEDLRLMSAWLNNSMDPISGADKRNEQYWGDVVQSYNMMTPKQRSRNAKQAKDRWHKINKWTDLFHNAWIKARQVFTSGYNDQMWTRKRISSMKMTTKI